MPCPECRHEFQIPKDGVAGLAVRTHGREPEPSAMCEVCSCELERNTTATVYCADCSQSLCERCSLPHLRMKGGPHDVKPLDAVSPAYRHGGRRYCQKHKERVKMYCFDCQTSVCSMCCLDSHKTHTFERIEDVRQKFARSIDDEIKQITSRIENICGVASHVEAKQSRFLDRIQATEREIKNKGEEVKRSFERRIDRQVSELLDKLQSMKSAAEKKVQSRTDAVQLALAELESFRTSSLELKSKCSPSDIVQAASDVRVRASELLQKHVIPAEHLAPSYTFTPADTDQLLTDDRNFIGDVATDTGMHCSFFYRGLVSTQIIYCG